MFSHVGDGEENVGERGEVMSVRCDQLQFFNSRLLVAGHSPQPHQPADGRSHASDKIFADQGSIVGSIGVIAQWVNYGDLLKWAKLKDVVIKTGEFKDTGNPARDLTPAEQAYMQSLIDNMFGQFIKAVSDGRGLKYDDVKSIANGKVWTGQQALSMKLIDQVGDFQTAVTETAKSVGIRGEPTLVRPERDRRTLMDLLLGDVSQYLPSREKLMEQQVGFYYLWK